MHKSKNTPKLRVTGLCAGNSPVTGEFPAQRASNAENVSIWWRHHDKKLYESFHQCIPYKVYPPGDILEPAQTVVVYINTLWRSVKFLMSWLAFKTGDHSPNFEVWYLMLSVELVIMLLIHSEKPTSARTQVNNNDISILLREQQC